MGTASGLTLNRNTKTWPFVSPTKFTVSSRVWIHCFVTHRVLPSISGLVSKPTVQGTPNEAAQRFGCPTPVLSKPTSTASPAARRRSRRRRRASRSTGLQLLRWYVDAHLNKRASERTVYMQVHRSTTAHSFRLDPCTVCSVGECDQHLASHHTHIS